MVPAYERAGTGPDAVLVPGTFSDRRAWRRLLGRLTPGLRCLLLDPRGTGDSADPGARFTVDDLVDDVLAAMDAAGVERAHLVGHSLGAAVAVVAAARHPTRVARVVAVGPAFHPDPYVEAVLDHWEALARSDLSDDALHRGLVLPAFGRDAFERLVPALVRDMAAHPLGRDTILRYVDCDRTQDLRPFAPRVDAPVLVVAGAEDLLTGPVHARALAGAIPGAAVELVAGSGHSPHVERPAELARLVVPFLLP